MAADVDTLTARRFADSYLEAFARHLGDPGEATLRAAYELGRQAIADELSVLDIAAVHHEALAEALAASELGELGSIVRSAADFLAETLSAAEMIRRGYGEVRVVEAEHRRRAAVIRRLTALLADTSLAGAPDDSIAELLLLVAEHACELGAADRCTAALTLERPPRTITGVSEGGEALDCVMPFEIVVPLLALDGSRLGSLTLSRSEGSFSPGELGAASQLALMASAALDRALMYRA